MNTVPSLADLARERGIPDEAYIPYGRDRAKIDHSWVESAQPCGHLVLVTAMSPTPAGEGKTTTSIGLADGLRRLGVKASLALREPSLGPVFGIKGGAIGGGRAQIIPANEINLHFNGDFSAIASAQNLLAAMTDNAVHYGTVECDPASISVRRAVDMNDRALRNIIVGVGGRACGPLRESGFDITAACEMMAAFCLANNFADLRERVKRIVVGLGRDGKEITAHTVQATEGILALLCEAFSPNLVRTMEGTPAFVHGGPFANIAHGCNSIMATRAALATSDIAVTEAGFGADLGAEKFFDIKCRQSGLRPALTVCVATIRALKYHGGCSLRELDIVNSEALHRGLANLERHVSNLVDVFGQKVIVALNRFDTDTPEEIADVCARMSARGIATVSTDHFSEGGAGAHELARAVCDELAHPSQTTFAYPDDATLKEKIDAVVTKIYHGARVTYSAAAQKEFARLERAGYGRLPVCIAKTPASFSADAKALGAPENFDFPIRDVRLSSGGGFVVVISGSIMLMPGLPRVPSAVNISVTDDGRVEGIR